MFEPETDIEFDYEKFRAVVHSFAMSVGLRNSGA